MFFFFLAATMLFQHYILEPDEWMVDLINLLNNFHQNATQRKLLQTARKFVFSLQQNQLSL